MIVMDLASLCRANFSVMLHTRRFFFYIFSFFFGLGGLGKEGGGEEGRGVGVGCVYVLKRIFFLAFFFFFLYFCFFLEEFLSPSYVCVRKARVRDFGKPRRIFFFRFFPINPNMK